MRLVEVAKARFAQARAASPTLDRVVRTQEQYQRTQASQFAGAVTYFGFLSIFPILALAFFAVGMVARVWPGAQDTLVRALGSILPGLIGGGAGQVSLATIQHAAGAVGVLGLVGVAYAGLGWLAALREALVSVFALPKDEQPNWLVGKVRDALTLVVLGVVLGLSVALTGWLTPWLSVPLGLMSDVVLMYALYRLLAEPRIPLVTGAILAALGFELLKQVSRLLLAQTAGTPAFQVFGVSLILLVWINYVSRVILYGAAFAAAGSRPLTRV